MLIRDIGLLAPQPDRRAMRFEPFPTIAVLSTIGDQPTLWVQAGQALQRVQLTAACVNLTTTPMSQPVELPTIRDLLTDTTTGLWAQMVIQLGYGRPAPRPRGGPWHRCCTEPTAGPEGSLPHIPRVVAS